MQKKCDENLSSSNTSRKKNRNNHPILNNMNQSKAISQGNVTPEQKQFIIDVIDKTIYQCVDEVTLKKIEKVM